MNTVLKFLQRRLYSFMGTWVGCLVVVLGVFATVLSVLQYLGSSSGGWADCSGAGTMMRGRREECLRKVYSQNIGETDSRPATMYAPIDVVYTWVNGSDPRWLKKMMTWRDRLHPAPSVGMGGANASTSIDGNSSSAANATAPEAEEGSDAHSLNRYRDSDELRYSFRSLEMYAPWVRNIYLVTDNQVPHWLNTNHPRIKLVNHDEIFENTSVLPVFSSPAIESQLHRIKGLSKKFIYFNDDVFLGSPVYPEDFTSVSGIQKLYFAWDVPKCAPGCNDNWIGDGYCDKACNVSSCDFDYPDCVNATHYGSTASGSSGSGPNRYYNVPCSPGCPGNWMADRTCDQKCKNPECGWDLGDCGIALMDSTMPSIVLNADDVLISIVRRVDGDALSAMVGPTSVTCTACGPEFNQSASVDMQQSPIVMTVRWGMKAIYFNLSGLPCTTQTDPTIPCKQNFTYTSASHISSVDVVHMSVLIWKHELLGVVFYQGQEGTPAPPDTFPVDVTFIVSGINADTKLSVEARFRVRMEAPDEDSLREGIPRGLYEVSGQTSVCIDGVIGSDETSTGKEDEMSEKFSGFDEKRFTPTLIRQPFLALAFFESSSNSAIVATASNATRTHNYKHGFAHLFRWGDKLLNRKHYSIAESHNVKLGDELLANIVVRQSIITKGHGTFETMLPLSDLVGTVNSRGLIGARPLPLRDQVSSMTLREYLSLPLKVDAMKALRAKPQFPELVAAKGIEWQKPLISKDSESLASFLLLTYLPALDLTSVPPVNASEDNNLTLPSVPVIETRWFQIKTEIFHLPNASDLSLPDAGPSAFHVLREMSRATPSNDLHDQNRVACFLTNLKWTQTDYARIIAEAGATSTPSHTRRLLEDRASAGPSAARMATAIPIVDDMSRGASQNSFDYERAWKRHSPVFVSDQVHKKRYLKGPSSLGLDEVDSGLPFSIRHMRKFIQDLVLQSSDASAGPADDAEDTGRGGAAHRASDALRSAVSRTSALGVSSRLAHRLVELSRRQFSYISHSVAEAGSAAIRAWSSDNDGDAPDGLGASSVDGARRARRRLASDTYGQSLIKVNRMYHKTFGYENRRVPAHMPHMIDKDIMTRMQNRWSSEWRDTAAHRFRSPQDMQYAFAYYYYVINKYKAETPDIAKYLSTEVDSNRDGYIDENEFRTLVAMTIGKEPTAADFATVHDCVFKLGNYSNATTTAAQTNSSSTATSNDSAAYQSMSAEETAARALAARILTPRRREMIANAVRSRQEDEQRHASLRTEGGGGVSGAANGSIDRLDVSVEVTQRLRSGVVHRQTRLERFPLVEEALACPLVVKGLSEWSGWPVTYIAGNENSIAFEMIGDNATTSISQLDSIRARRPKFICINDNMKEPTEELLDAVHDFFRALYPFPSKFELPAGASNPTLYTDEIRKLAKPNASKQRGALNAMRSVMSLGKTIVVELLREILNFMDGPADGDHATGVFLVLHRAVGRSEQYKPTYSAGSARRGVRGVFGAVHHGESIDAQGVVYRTTSYALPYSMLAVSVVALCAIVMLFLVSNRRRRGVDSNAVYAPLPPTHIKKAATKDAEAAALRIAASIAAASSKTEDNYSSASSSRANASGVSTSPDREDSSGENRLSLAAVDRPLYGRFHNYGPEEKRDSSDDILNVLWRKAGYGGGDAEVDVGTEGTVESDGVSAKPGSPGALRNNLDDDDDEGSEGGDDDEGNTQQISTVTSSWEDSVTGVDEFGNSLTLSAASPKAGYEKGILKKPGAAARFRKKKVTWSNVDSDDSFSLIGAGGRNVFGRFYNAISSIAAIRRDRNVATGDSSVTNESPSGAGSSSDSAGNGSASTSGSADGGGGIKKTTKAD